jgi:hypothetical protein
MAQIDIDLMEYSTPELAQAAYVTDGATLSNADIDDEDMADITDWSDDDIGTGVSSQVTFDGKSCMKLDCPDLNPNEPRRTQDIGSFGSRAVISLSVYCDSIGTMTADDYFFMSAQDGSAKLNVAFASDGLFVFNGSTYVEAGADLVVQDTWQEWSFDIDWTNKKVDVYLNKSLKASQMDLWTSAGTNGLIWFSQYAFTTGGRLTYIDWFKAGSATNGGLDCFSENTIKTQGSYSLKCGAVKTDSLNKTLTRIIGSPIDLTGQGAIKFDIRSSRTGSNIKIGIRDSGGTTTETTPNIASADTYQRVIWDISGVSNANKDAIDSIIITIVNSDSINTFYIDNCYATTGGARSFGIIII